MLALSIISALLTGFAAILDKLFPEISTPRLKKRMIIICLSITFLLALIAVSTTIINRFAELKGEKDADAAKLEAKITEMEHTIAILSVIRDQKPINPRDSVKTDTGINKKIILPSNPNPQIKGKTYNNNKTRPSRPAERNTLASREATQEDSEVADDEQVETDPKQRGLNPDEKEAIASELSKIIMAYHEGNLSIPVVIKTDPNVLKYARDLLDFLKAKGYKKAEIYEMASMQMEGSDKMYEIGASNEAGRLPVIEMYRLVKKLGKS